MRVVRAGMVVALVGLLGLLALPTASGQDADLSGVPRARCGPGSDPEPAEQGRVPAEDHESGRADRPYTCNTELVGHHGSTGGFKVHRYVDANGTECAYYDSTLLFPLDVAKQLSDGLGVIVLDMTDPSDPVATTTLTTPGMLSPHESLVLNEERGLLAAVMGTAATYPGVVDVYDVSEDCTDPTLLSSSPVGFLGHESGFSPDGRTLYAASTAAPTVAAVDVTDPTSPQTLWVGNVQSHGLTVSDDGTRLYMTPLDLDSLPLTTTGEFDSGIAILDVTDIQERAPNPDPQFLSRLTWPEASISQTAIPVTIDGDPHLVEIDEFINFRDWATPAEGVPGAARLIDIGDETSPRVVSNIRLEVHDPAVRRSSGLLDDPGARRPYQGYAGHYCSVPRREDPGIVACSMIMSGLRVFDIRDPEHPREIAYFNAPADPSSLVVNPDGAPFAMSAPAFVPERGEIWYSDTASGFWAVRVTNDVWPFPDETADTGPDPTAGTTAPTDAALPAVADTTDDGQGEPAAGPTTPSTGTPSTTALAALALLVAALLARRVGDR